MGDALGKREENMNNPGGVWADIGSVFGPQVKVDTGAFGLVQNALGKDFAKNIYVSPLDNVFKTAISREYGEDFARIVRPSTPFRNVQDIMGGNVSRFIDVMKPPSIVDVFGAHSKSNWIGASKAIDFGFTRMLQSQYSFADAFAANIGTLDIAKTFNFNALQGLTKSVEFKKMMASPRWSTTIEQPLREYLEDDPFSKLEELAEELGIEELSEEQEEFAAEFLKSQPSIATAITATPGYWDASPAYRALVVRIIAIAVGMYVGFGVLVLEKDHPLISSLATDLGILPLIAGTAAGSGVIKIGNKMESTFAKALRDTNKSNLDY